ncbi:MAG: hypothetical protein GY913_02600 [Proteobacteria bacterium]|nr:hypothetical protein [Pseudomonadota bacterium]MCP4915788.1 hypothetical protein [Pseudomonadota bacterium]
MLLVWLSACINAPCAGVDGPKLHVSPQEGGADLRRFSTIQAALDHAEPGTTICVEEGHYLESPGLFTQGIQLLGAGPDHVLIETDEETGVQIGADAFVSGLRIRGASTGVYVAPGVQAELHDLDLAGGRVGILASEPERLALVDVDISETSRVALVITATGGSAHQGVTIDRGALLDNGSERSEVGGIYSDIAIEIEGTRFSNNRGELAADVLGRRHVTLVDVALEQPTSSTSPRVVADDGLTALDTVAMTQGTPAFDVRCLASGLDVSNTAVADSVGGTAALMAQDCTGRVVHSTFAALDGAPAASVVLSGSGDIEFSNDALVGSTGVEASSLDGNLREANLFIGSLSEARLLAPLPAAPDLRPQADSPLVDGGEELGVEQDVDGRPRPSGDAPDIGAYELY